MKCTKVQSGNEDVGGFDLPIGASYCIPEGGEELTGEDVWKKSRDLGGKIGGGFTSMWNSIAESYFEFDDNTRSYWAEKKSLSAGFSEAAKETKHLTRKLFEDSPCWVQKTGGVATATATLALSIPIGLADWGLEVAEQIPKGPNHAIYRFVEVPASAMIHGVEYVYGEASGWVDGSLSNEDPFGAAYRVTTATGTALLTFLMARSLVNGLVNMTPTSGGGNAPILVPELAVTAGNTMALKMSAIEFGKPPIPLVMMSKEQENQNCGAHANRHKKTDTIGQMSPKHYKTWKELWTSLKSKTAKIREAVKAPNKFDRLKQWCRNRMETTKQEIMKKQSEMPKTGRLKWFAGRIKAGFKSVFKERVRNISNTAINLKNGIVKLIRRPTIESLDFINRPGKMIRYMFTGYGVAAFTTSTLRYLTGSTKINPVGSELFPDSAKGLIEPALGVVGSTSIGASITHYIFGWNFGAAIMFESIFALQPAFFQAKSGGANAETVDWNRVNMNTAAESFIWGWLGPYKNISNAAFPGLTWIGFLTKLEKRGHPLLSKIFRLVPAWLAPKNVPTFGDYATYSIFVNLHTASLAIYTDAISSKQNILETTKFHAARMGSVYLFTRWFDAAFDPFSRPIMGVISSFMKVGLYSELSAYFQLYKGKQFYRNIFKDLVKNNIPSKKALEVVADALAKERFFNNIPDFVWEDCYDFYNDLRNGEFNDKEVNYFMAIANDNEIVDSRQRHTQLVLSDIVTGNFDTKENFMRVIEAQNQ